MSRVKHPIEKKRLSLHKDHRVFALEGNNLSESMALQEGEGISATAASPV
jgi:hypothetical protein